MRRGRVERRGALLGETHARRRRLGGAAAVEFALILPMFMVMLLGMIDWGWWFYVDLAATNAVREGARAATTWAGACPNADALAAGEQTVNQYLTNFKIVDHATVTGSCSNAPGSGDPLFRFDVTLNFSRLTGFTLVPMPAAGEPFPSHYVAVRTSAAMRGVQ